MNSGIVSEVGDKKVDLETLVVAGWSLIPRKQMSLPGEGGTEMEHEAQSSHFWVRYF